MKKHSSKKGNKKRGGASYQDMSTAKKVGLAVLYLVVVYIIIILVVWFVQKSKKDKMYKTLPGGMTVYRDPRSRVVQKGKILKPFQESMPGLAATQRGLSADDIAMQMGRAVMQEAGDPLETGSREPENELLIRQGEKAAQLLLGNEAANDIAKKESYLHHNMPYY